MNATRRDRPSRAGRPVDQERRDELLEGVVAFAIEHGLSHLTWRPVAAALGVSTTSLVHRFGSKEGMMQEVQRRLRQRILTETGPAPGEPISLAEFTRTLWERTSDPARAGEFRLFFATYGAALQSPLQFEEFLAHVIADPVHALESVAIAEGASAPKTAATLILATLRGLLLDLLTTGDVERVHAAADVFFSAFDSLPEMGGRRQ